MTYSIRIVGPAGRERYLRETSPAGFVETEYKRATQYLDRASAFDTLHRYRAMCMGQRVWMGVEDRYSEGPARESA